MYIVHVKLFFQRNVTIVDSGCYWIAMYFHHVLRHVYWTSSIQITMLETLSMRHFRLHWFVFIHQSLYCVCCNICMYVHCVWVCSSYEATIAIIIANYYSKHECTCKFRVLFKHNTGYVYTFVLVYTLFLAIVGVHVVLPYFLRNENVFTNPHCTESNILISMTFREGLIWLWLKQNKKMLFCQIIMCSCAIARFFKHHISIKLNFHWPLMQRTTF